jgi:hypothetical protein
MTLPLPPWEFRSQRDARQFKVWMNKQLDELYEPTPDDIWREVQMVNDEAYVKATMTVLGRRLMRRRVVIAAQDRDFNALNRLTADDPELRNLAFRLLARKRGRGRAKGERRPSDLMPVERVVLQDASAKRLRWRSRPNVRAWIRSSL